ncbi:MAG TPA: AAA family ATPase [Myxococcaceae bacterium]|nr:AAA family ATPase [Myxococcaceae bacterium]
MLTRLYVDNYKCLVKFDLRLGKQHLLMGKNGAGKTTVFEVLAALRRIAHGEEIADVLSYSTLTRWGGIVQRFELEAVIKGKTYVYDLQVELPGRVLAERLLVDGVADFSRNQDEVRLGHGSGGAINIDSGRAALAKPTSGYTGTGRLVFTDWLFGMNIIRIDPRRMKGESEKEEFWLESDLSNFASWFRHIAQEHLGSITELNLALHEVLDGFDSINLRTEGGKGVRVIESRWRLNEGGAIVSYSFDELSEGQRALIGLYSLLYFAPTSGTTLCLDEPDNFVALREIQPFLLALRERENIQSLIISHHPEVINLLAPESGLMFERVAGGPARVEPFRAPPDAALPPAELIARGWEDGK